MKSANPAPPSEVAMATSNRELRIFCLVCHAAMEFKFSRGAVSFACPECIEKSWSVVYDRDRGIGAIPVTLLADAREDGERR